VLRVIARVGRWVTPSLLTFCTRSVIRLLYPLVTQKISVEQSFRKGKIISEFSQERVFTKTRSCSKSPCILRKASFSENAYKHIK